MITRSIIKLKWNNKKKEKRNMSARVIYPYLHFKSPNLISLISFISRVIKLF